MTTQTHFIISDGSIGINVDIKEKVNGNTLTYDKVTLSSFLTDKEIDMMERYNTIWQVSQMTKNEVLEIVRLDF